MKKLLFFIVALLGLSTSGAWATSYYFVGGRTSASDITTGKKYMIYNTARRYFLSASGSAYGLTNNTTPLTFTSTNDYFVWTLEEGSASGTYKIKNVGTSTYGAGTSLVAAGSAVDYTIAEYSTCPSKGGMASYNDDGTQTAAASITSADNAVYIQNTSSSKYFNGSGSAFDETAAAHVYVLYEVIEIVEGGCYTIDFESNDGTKFWAVSTSGTSVSVAQQTSAAQGSVFVAHAYVNAQGQQRWVFVNNSDGYFLAYKEATDKFNHEKPINEFSVAAIYKGVNTNVTTDNCNGKVYMITDNRSTSSTYKGCYILQESSATFNVSPAIADAPFYNGSYTSAMRITPNAASASATATLAIAKFNALYQVKDVVACASNMSALFGDPGTLIDDINAAATAEAANTLATNYMKSAEGKKFYAVCSGATGQYLNVGTSVVSATSTELTAEAVMELEYAGYGKYYIKGVKSGYYANVPVANNAAPTTTSNKGVAGSFFIGNYANTNDNEGVYFAKTKLTGGNTVAFHYSTSYTYRTCGWGYDAGNSHWNITAISDDDYDILANVSAVTYNVILAANGTVKATTTKDVRKGNTVAIPSEIAKDYCTYTYYSDAACTTPISVVPDAATTTVYALASYTMPFTVSSDFASATWYYATLRGKYLRADDNAKDDSGRYSTNASNEHTDAYKWAFFGNPYDGFYVMNKNQGDSKYLYKETQLVFKSGITPAEDNNALFAVSSNSNGGFTLRNIAGGDTWYINDAGSGGNLGFWNTSSGANDAGSNWVITEVPAIEIDVTYDLYVGGEKVDTYVDSHVAGNSAINIPASWTTSFIAYDLGTSGSIGTEDCTITVTATLKSSTKTPAELSNTKKYRLVSVRGGLSTYTDETVTYLASPCKTALGISAKEFAILSYLGRNYLYSVSDEKFVIFDGADNQKAKVRANVTGTIDAVTFTATSNYRYAITFNNETSKYLNSSPSYAYGIVINGWGGSGYWDDGNRYVIEEVGDFDSSSALSALTTFIDGQASTFASVITELKAINWSEVGNAGQLNRYNFIGDFVGFAGNEVACLATLESNGYTTENLQYAQLLNTKGTGYALNMPATGKFYRIKGYSNNYITSNAAGSNASMNGTASANNIVYYSADQNLIFFGSGYGLYNTCIVAPATATLNTYTFSEGVQSSHYNLTSNASGVGTYCYDHTGDGTKLNRNSDAVTSGNYETDWTLEEVTTLPVAISGEYASFYSPVDLTIPEGVEVYTATLNGAKDRLNMTLVESGTLPANTGVILKKTGSNNTVNFPVLTTTTPGESDLLGTVAAESCEADTKLVLGKASETWGIYNFGGTTLGGFKAYMNKSDVNTVKGLSFNFGTIDAITSLLNGEQNNGEYYDLSGRRVNAPVKGLYIVNGKKVLVK